MLSHANFVNGLRLSALTQNAFPPVLNSALAATSLAPSLTPPGAESAILGRDESTSENMLSIKSSTQNGHATRNGTIHSDVEEGVEVDVEKD